MSEQTNNDLGHTLGRIEGTLERFEQTLEKFDHQLFGNGQPGKLAIIEKRLADLEESRSKFKGAVAAFTALGATELYHLIFGRR